MRRPCPFQELAIAILLAALTCGTSTAAEQPELNQAQQLVFMGDHLLDVPQGQVLAYDFESHSKDGRDLSDQVRMTVTGVQADNGRDLTFEFLSAENQISFPSARGYRGNPVIIQFLERDIRDMARASGGSAGYFRNRIRNSFANPRMRNVRLPFFGTEVDAVEIRVSPFANDPNISMFERYRYKSYELVFSKQVPGGLYRIHTLVPGEDGPWMEEELRFNRMTDAG